MQRNRPGAYIHYNQDRPIYIGMSKVNVFNRGLSHLSHNEEIKINSKKILFQQTATGNEAERLEGYLTDKHILKYKRPPISNLKSPPESKLFSKSNNRANSIFCEKNNNVESFTKMALKTIQNNI